MAGFREETFSHQIARENRDPQTETRNQSQNSEEKTEPDTPEPSENADLEVSRISESQTRDDCESPDRNIEHVEFLRPQEDEPTSRVQMLDGEGKTMRGQVTGSALMSRKGCMN